ncbi:unnamed protein product [Schistocephalus solidus]|uniref:YcgL domain-containing protein n=1 Tax=Schistocephalus solidus TaxID=70667 RepID=A0A183SS91_SCHSO|nr:unnamed protein product [Schistocephalus solidus]
MTCLIRFQERQYSEEFSVHFNRLKPLYLEGEKADHLEMQASPSHQDDTQVVKHFQGVLSEDGYALPEVFNDEHQVKKLAEVPP